MFQRFVIFLAQIISVMANKMIDDNEVWHFSEKKIMVMYELSNLFRIAKTMRKIVDLGDIGCLLLWLLFCWVFF